ncbi:MAG: serine endoprotease DegQ, partial [Gammaproteobacteria bacterium SG8_11]
MKRFVTVLVLFFAVMNLGFTPPASAGLPLSLLSSDVPSLAPMLEKTIPGVVNISTKTKIRVQENPLFSDPFFRRFFDLPNVPRERESQSLGSGVIIDAKKGYVLTNNHVIDKADEITVTLGDRRSFTAKVIGTDPEVDLAVIQIDADNLTA